MNFEQLVETALCYSLPINEEETQELDNIHELAERAFESFQQKIEALNRRLSKHGISPIQIEVKGEKFVPHQKNKEIKIRKVIFKLDIPDLNLPGGWEFVASVNHEDIGNIIQKNPNAKFQGDLHALFGNEAPTCDYCHTKRDRAATFILQNEKGELKRVGKTCLKLFLPGGVKDAQKILDYSQMFSDLLTGLRSLENSEGEYDDEGGGGGYGREQTYYSLESLVGLAIFLIKHKGFVSKKMAMARAEGDNSNAVETTASEMDYFLSGRWKDDAKSQKGGSRVLFDLFEQYEDSASDTATIQKFLDWAPPYIENQLKNGNPAFADYFNNLKNIVTKNGDPLQIGADHAINKKYAGYIAAIANSFIKEGLKPVEKEVAAEKESHYVGVVGFPIGELSYQDKRKFKLKGLEVPNAGTFPYAPFAVTVAMQPQTFERQSYSYYDEGGVTHLYNFMDESGNQYVWFSPHELQDVEKGTKLVIRRALVKNHKEYTSKKTGKTSKQTVLSRVDFHE